MRYRLGLILACFAIGCGWSAPLIAQEPEEGTILGAPPAFDLSGQQNETVWIDAEARLHRQPARRSPVLTTFTSGVELPVLERRPGWVRVRFSSWQGWVPTLLDGPDDPEVDDTDQPWWTPRIEADREHLERARGFLDGERLTRLGDYRLYTDLDDEELLTRLSGLARQLPSAFQRRFGLEASVEEPDTVVLFKADASYRAYVESSEEPAAVGSLGHAIGGLAVLSVGERKTEEVRKLLIHELTHVLTYHALGPNLPAWLAEGLAEDMAYNRVTAKGEMELGTLGSWSSATSTPFRQSDGQIRFLITTTHGGAEASLEDLRKQWRPRKDRSSKDPLSLEELVGLSSTDFMAVSSRQVYYALSTFLIRYLLDFPGSSERFQTFLQAVASGDLGSSDDLRNYLATSWEDLETGFGTWLKSSAPKRGQTAKKKKHQP